LTHASGFFRLRALAGLGVKLLRSLLFACCLRFDIGTKATLDYSGCETGLLHVHILRLAGVAAAERDAPGTSPTTSSTAAIAGFDAGDLRISSSGAGEIRDQGIFRSCCCASTAA